MIFRKKDHCFFHFTSECPKGRIDARPGQDYGVREKKSMDVPQKSMKLRTYLLLTTSVLFIVAAGIFMTLMYDAMRQQALREAELKEHLMLDRNLAIHTYFSHDVKPKLFELLESVSSISEDYFERKR